MRQRFYRVQVCKADTSPLDLWFFRLRWLNGRIALTSETYTRRAIVRKLAKQFHAGFSSGVGALVKFEDLT